MVHGCTNSPWLRRALGSVQAFSQHCRYSQCIFFKAAWVRFPLLPAVRLSPRFLSASNSVFPGLDGEIFPLRAAWECPCPAARPAALRPDLSLRRFLAPQPPVLRAVFLLLSSPAQCRASGWLLGKQRYWMVLASDSKAKQSWMSPAGLR